MAKLDWHAAPISRDTPVDKTYKSTQNVRRFMTLHCGAAFRFDRPFMAWIQDGTPKTMGDVIDAWGKKTP